MITPLILFIGTASFLPNRHLGAGWISAAFEIEPEVYYVLGVFYHECKYPYLGGGFEYPRAVGMIIILSLFIFCIFNIGKGSIRTPSGAGVFWYNRTLQYPPINERNAEYFVTPLFVSD